MSDVEALFEPAGADRYVPTSYSRGPWDPAHCHGGPVSALLTRAIERHEPGDVDWHVARVTVELIRPVPVGRALTLSPTLERPGRRVSLVAALLHDGETEVARVRGLRIRREDIGLPGDEGSPGTGSAGDEPGSAIGRWDVAFPAGPDESRHEHLEIIAGERDLVSFARQACEHRFAAGNWMDPGPVAVWIRLTVPVVPGETPSGAQRATAAADFGNGVSSVLPWEDFVFINPDLTVHLVRPAGGEWIGLLASTALGVRGTGLAQSALHDPTGPIGRSLQSLYVAPR